MEGKKMTTGLPYWIEVLQALSTPAIALLALVIGYFQWRTSHQRAVVELFEKRMAVYDAIRAVMAEVLREGAIPDKAPGEFIRVVDKVEFLFGPEVKKYLDNLYQLLIRHRAGDKLKDHIKPENQKREEDAYVRRLEKFSAFFEEFPRLEPISKLLTAIDP